MSDPYSHLPHILDHSELRLYELIPDVVWIFDLDKHGWWWGNQAAIDFWGLTNLDELIDKDLSGDTQGARDRTWQTFELAQQQGLTIDPWTTYPNGKPKTLYMRHRAALVGPDRHRAIIAFVNEEVNLGEVPENLLLMEAMRYTQVLVTSFDLNGRIITENPAATAAYVASPRGEAGLTDFAARFSDPEAGQECLARAITQEGGRWTCQMQTVDGERRHTLDIRQTRHPLTGDFLLLVVEYDVTSLQHALDLAGQTQSELKKLAHFDPLTNLPNVRHFEEGGDLLLQSARHSGQQLALLFVDLDGFKAINDRYGHQCGDLALKTIAGRLRAHSRASDIIARIGGDEFVLLQSAVSARRDVQAFAEKLIEVISEPFDVEGVTVCLSASIGVAEYPRHAVDMNQLLRRADQAMYSVKYSGKGLVAFYAAEEDGAADA